MPWQRYVAETALELLPDDSLAYQTVGLSVGRQEGKSSLLDLVQILRCARRRQQVLYLCHDRSLAANRLIELGEAGAATYAGIVRSNGRESLNWPGTGSRWAVAAGTAKSARSRSVDLAVIDEAALLGFDVVDAIGPTQLARPDPQLWIASNAGDETSDMWRQYTDIGRKAALSDLGTGVAWFEWGATDEQDRTAPATWRLGMPALGFTINEKYVAAKQQELAEQPERFDREYLNRWARLSRDERFAEHWLSNKRADIQLSDPVSFSLEIARDRESAVIVAAGASGPETIACDVVDIITDMTVIPMRLKQLAERWEPCAIVIDPAGPAGAVLVEMRALGVDIVPFTTRDFTQACGAFYDQVNAGNVHHRGSALLDRAVVAAGRRNLNDAWCWDRDRPDGIALTAASLARWGLRRWQIMGMGEIA